MKGLDLQEIVKCKHQNGDSVSKIFNDLSGVTSLPTIKIWVKMLDETVTIKLGKSPGRPRIARTKANILKVKQRLNRKKKVSTRKLGKELNISNSSVHRILQDDLGYFSYKKNYSISNSRCSKTKKNQIFKLAIQ